MKGTGSNDTHSIAILSRSTAPISSRTIMECSSSSDVHSIPACTQHTAPHLYTSLAVLLWKVLVPLKFTALLIHAGTHCTAPQCTTISSGVIMEGALS